MDLSKAKEACANGEVLHSSSFMFEGKEVKMTTKSCPGMPTLTGETNAEPANQLEKRDVMQCPLAPCASLSSVSERCHSNGLRRRYSAVLRPRHTNTIQRLLYLELRSVV